MLAALLMAALPTVSAAAYYSTDIGTRGLSRGGAYIAGNRDLSAQYYNPAALVNLVRPQAYLNYSLVHQAVDFTKEGRETVHNLGKPMQIPAMGVAHHFGVPNTMFALGMHAPFAPDMAYPPEGPQRYTLIDSLVWQVYGGPSVAHRFSFAPWLSVGAGFIWTLVRAEETLSVNVCDASKAAEGEARSCDANGGRETDLRIKMEMVDKATFTGNFGVLIEPKSWLKIGLSLMPPIPIKGKGSLAADFDDQHWMAPNLKSTHTEDKDITVTLNMPLIVRGGVAVNPVDNWQIEFATVYERWQITEEIRISDLSLQLNPKLSDEQAGLAESLGLDLPTLDPIILDDDVVLPANYQSTMSLRLGTEYDLGERFSFRGGTFYEQSAIPPETQGVTLVDGPKFGYGLGASYHFRKLLSVDLGWGQSFIQRRTIEDSELARLEIPVDIPYDKILAGEDATIESEIRNGKIVGNGEFAAHTSMFSMGLTVYFGKDMRTVAK